MDLWAATDSKATTASGVAHSEVLIAFADAMVGGDDAALAPARNAVVQALGPEAMVDAAGVAANFERMVRIADATGIPLDKRMMDMTQGIREELQLERFAVGKGV